METIESLESYRRQLTEDVTSFANIVEPFILSHTGDEPIILALQYPGIGNPYGAGIHYRFQSAGRAHKYHDVRFANSNHHIDGYIRDEIRGKTVFLLGIALRNDMLPYLRELREDAADLYFGFRLPVIGVMKVEEIERIFGV